MAAGRDEIPPGPEAVEGEELPKTVQYCGVCGMPPEFCEYGPKFDKCKPWLQRNAPHIWPGQQAQDGVGEAADGVAALDVGEEGAAGAGGAAAAGGGAQDEAAVVEQQMDKHAKKPKGKKPDRPQLVIITTRSIKSRGKKMMTVVVGLDLFGIKLKPAAKRLAKRFGTGGSVGKTTKGHDCVELQGDRVDRMPGYIMEELGDQVPRNKVYVLVGKKARPAFQDDE